MNQPAQPATRIGQATTIEMSRAEAEVKAAVVIAQQNPRNIHAAVDEMRFACQQYALAEKAFFSYPKGKETITGPSVHLARELALIWGNVQHGTMELSRDTGLGQSEILAYAWDLQRNSRSSQIFIAPHVRDTRQGKKDLTDLRDVYENNANLGARRLREAIFAMLPAWYVSEAVSICEETLKKGNGQTLAERVTEAIQTYDRVGITVHQLETKVGRPQDQWDEKDITDLEVIYRSVDRKEMTPAEAFPPPKVTADEITGGQRQNAEPGSEVRS
ncbi:hypothetical protein [Streptomyces sp. NPDC048196]|uniref:hypothetical protein n=1 Tax=Streptomyces sp. NPDC048196 TaxID=3154712 RepID=UPI0033CD1906